MDGDTLYSIGELARRTGLTVKTIRFSSDRGIVSPTDRGPAGCRRYNNDAAARLDFVRTLRGLGIDLPTIRKSVDRELSLPEVAAAHADALAVQIRVVFGRRETSPAFAGVIRSMSPELADNSEAEQVQAWVELAELSQDPDFRASMRRMVEDQAAEQDQSESTGPRPDIAAVVRDQVGPALTAGIDPASPQADPTVAAITAHHAHLLGRRDDVELHCRLAARLESVNDPRRERYLKLLAVINGWSPPKSLAQALDWSVQALRVRTQR